MVPARTLANPIASEISTRVPFCIATTGLQIEGDYDVGSPSTSFAGVCGTEACRALVAAGASIHPADGEGCQDWG